MDNDSNKSGQTGARESAAGASVAIESAMGMSVAGVTVNEDMEANEAGEPDFDQMYNAVSDMLMGKFWNVLIKKFLVYYKK